MVDCRCKCPDCKSEFMQKFDPADLPPKSGATLRRVKCYRCAGANAAPAFKDWIKKEVKKEKFLPAEGGKR